MEGFGVASKPLRSSNWVATAASMHGAHVNVQRNGMMSRKRNSVERRQSTELNGPSIFGEREKERKQIKRNIKSRHERAFIVTIEYRGKRNYELKLY